MRVKGAMVLATAALALSGLMATSAAAGVVGGSGQPNRVIVGGWQILHTGPTADGGATRFHYERDPAGGRGTVEAEISWHAAPVAGVVRQIEAEGLAAAGSVRTNIIDGFALQAENWDQVFRPGTARAFIAPVAGPGGLFEVAGVWEEEGLTWEVDARSESLYMLERLLERVELVSDEEWAADVARGTAEKVAAAKKKRRHAKHAKRKHAEKVGQRTRAARR